MKYVVASGQEGKVEYMDNRLFDHKQDALKRMQELNKEGLRVFEISEFIMGEVE